MVVRLSTATLIFHDVNSPMIIQVGPLQHSLLRHVVYASSISTDIWPTNTPDDDCPDDCRDAVTYNTTLKGATNHLCEILKRLPTCRPRVERPSKMFLSSLLKGLSQRKARSSSPSHSLSWPAIRFFVTRWTRSRLIARRWA